MLVAVKVNPIQNRKRPPIANGVIAIIIFIVTEIMFFAALISSYLVLRSNAEEWPPWGQPRLPVETTAFNSLALLLSGWVLYKAYQSFSKGNDEELPKVRKLLGLSILLGVFFVGFQGYEWAQLIQFGLTISSSTFGGLFYLIIGTHALHAVAALIALIYTYLRLAPHATSKLTATEFVVPQIFWCFVVGIWPILYVLVYLV